MEKRNRTQGGLANRGAREGWVTHGKGPQPGGMQGAARRSVKTADQRKQKKKQEVQKDLRGRSNAGLEKNLQTVKQMSKHRRLPENKKPGKKNSKHRKGATLGVTHERRKTEEKRIRKHRDQKTTQQTLEEKREEERGAPERTQGPSLQLKSKRAGSV